MPGKHLFYTRFLADSVGQGVSKDHDHPNASRNTLPHTNSPIRDRLGESFPIGVTREMFEGRVQWFLQWLDDFILCAKNEKKLLDDTSVFSDVFREVRFKLNPKKSSFFTAKVKFCERVKSSKRIRFDRRNVEVLLAINPPQNEEGLQQLLCPTNCMRTAILDYARLIEPLHEMHEHSCRKAYKVTKSAVKKFKLD